MANSVWVSSTGAGVKYSTTTINSTDNNTEILSVKPQHDVSISIDIGASESLSILISTEETPVIANMIAPNAAITADNLTTFKGITALKINGAVTNASNVFVVEYNSA